eukprot:CAMPEP_0171293848 /NCGR_PEP_ID=MMETSP0816-20121228/2204_1 /TAXON_ID=420281 /ORGANISM="Proboscia inermis, Strain CCAP1064/1" /LENGTH=345 /DNA_ID=CAMNT_0011765123 /DNA_START=152 /DNA_END=1189 /DNA_ORIENTATION=-
MRRTKGAAESWAKNNVPADQKCKGYDEVDELLSDPRVTAVYISTPPGSHLEIAKRVALAGKPAYIEKPVGRCYKETSEIVELFRKSNVKCFTAYTSRAFERTSAVVKILTEGAIGERVTSISYTCRGSGLVRGLDSESQIPWRLDASQSGGGLVMDIGCHLLDRIDYIFGPLIDVVGEAKNCSSNKVQQVENIVHLKATIGSSSWSCIESKGASVQCVWDFNNEKNESPIDELIIRGSNGGCLKMAGMSPSLPISVLDADDKVIKTMAFKAPEHATQPLLQLVTDEIRLGSSVIPSPSNGENALRTSAVLDAALNAYYGNRSDEFWNRSNTWPGLLLREQTIKLI